MRKAFGIALTLGLLVGALGLPAAEAKKKKKKQKPRTVETTYSEPAYGTAGLGVCFQGASCVFVEPVKGERFVTVEIEDESGLPVFASIIQDTNGDGSYLATDDETTHICGSTEEPLRIEPQTVTVWVWNGPGASPPCAGTATAGMVTTTFSPRR